MSRRFFLVVRNMDITNRSEVTRRVEEEIANTGDHPQENQAPPQENQAPPQEQVPLGDQAPVIPQSMMDGDIRSTFVTLDQAMTTQALDIATQAQIMTAKSNWEVRPRVNQNSSTMVSRLWDFTRMSPPMFFGSEVHEDPQDLFDEIYKTMSDMGLISNEKVELDAYQLKDVAQTWFTQWKDNRALIEAPIS
ncbi:hypothetical protein EJD97_007489 [Solanum chilense]|uniref:Uncharacterized protein n=1 Tax=Solanum chilense TaxID=4083 RepID=A0A6N2BTW5_SOLCI|nr:hypothetical protein EJD97_007489 [Solanum chilense]